MTYTGHTVLITGGASGIGLELAAQLLDGGNTVVVCGRSEEKLRAARQRLPRLHVRVADVGDADARSRLASEVVHDFPELDVLINNAGTLNIIDLLASAPEAVMAQYAAESRTNVEGPLHLALLLLPHFRQRPRASIVNVTTGYVYAASARTPAYAATKSALHAWTQALRLQLRDTAISVVEVIPPGVDSAMSSHYKGSKLTPRVFVRKLMRALAQGRSEVRVGDSALLYWAARLWPRFALAAANPDSERFPAAQ